MKKVKDGHRFVTTWIGSAKTPCTAAAPHSDQTHYDNGVQSAHTNRQLHLFDLTCGRYFFPPSS